MPIKALPTEVIPGGGFKPIPLTYSPVLPMGRGGMNTRQPATELPPEQATNIQNALVEIDGLQIAWGYTEMGSAIGDTDTVVRAINQFRQLDLTTELVRVTNDHAYVWAGASWAKTSLAADAAMTGTDVVVGTATVQDVFLIAKNGESALVQYTGTTGTGGLAEIAGSPAARFVIGFADRAVAAYTTANPQLVQWSVSGDVTTWTGAGSGSASLVEDPTAAMDEITGLTVQRDNLMIYRRNSIWVGKRTGQASPAIGFTSQVQGIGNMAPMSLRNVGSTGDIFLGPDDVYLYHPGNREPIRIGTPIQKEIFDNLNRAALNNVHACYIRDEQKYVLWVPVSSETYPTRGWEFDVRRYRTSQQLVWRRRDANGNGDSISASFGGRTGGLTDVDSVHKMVLGTELGETFDSDASDTTDDGGTITLTYESPEFTTGDQWIQVARLLLWYTSTSAGTVTVAPSIDGGVTYGTAQTVTLPPSTGVRPYGVFLRGGMGRTVKVRVRSTDTDRPVFRSYQLGVYERGQFRGAFL